MSEKVLMWLDDVRPAPEGWLHVKNVTEAKYALLKGNVESCSLDHDLGICRKCMPDAEIQVIAVVQDINRGCNSKICKCECHETGSDLVDWMEEMDVWSKNKPVTHSANPIGRQYMRRVINKKFGD